MKLVKRDDGWWITDVPDSEDCGPYATRPEAKDDMDGLQRTFDHWDDHRFWTVEKLG
jgi:hypothetical protein